MQWYDAHEIGVVFFDVNANKQIRRYIHSFNLSSKHTELHNDNLFHFVVIFVLVVFASPATSIHSWKWSINPSINVCVTTAIFLTRPFLRRTHHVQYPGGQRAETCLTEMWHNTFSCVSGCFLSMHVAINLHSQANYKHTSSSTNKRYNLVHDMSDIPNEESSSLFPMCSVETHFFIPPRAPLWARQLALYSLMGGIVPLV